MHGWPEFASAMGWLLLSAIMLIKTARRHLAHVRFMREHRRLVTAALNSISSLILLKKRSDAVRW